MCVCVLRTKTPTGENLAKIKIKQTPFSRRWNKGTDKSAYVHIHHQQHRILWKRRAVAWLLCARTDTDEDDVRTHTRLANESVRCMMCLLHGRVCISHSFKVYNMWYFASVVVARAAATFDYELLFPPSEWWIGIFMMFIGKCWIPYNFSILQ